MIKIYYTIHNYFKIRIFRLSFNNFYAKKKKNSFIIMIFSEPQYKGKNTLKKNVQLFQYIIKN